MRPEGNFIDSQGNVLGTHRGIHAFTIGQRRGLGIGFGERVYVTAINSKTNEVTLGSKTDLQSQGLIATAVTWTNDQWPALLASQNLECGVKIRYQQGEIRSSLMKDVNEQQVKIHFYESPPSVSPGQAVVFYKEDEVIGGGWIHSRLHV